MEPADQQKGTGMAASDIPAWFRIALRTVPDVLTAGRHSRDFHFYRSGHLLVRVRLFAVLFAVATPAWIPVDAWLLPRQALSGMVALRLVVAGTLAAIAIFWPSHRSRYNGLSGIAALVGILLAFHFSSQALIGGTMDRPELIGYTTLPLFLIACVTLFPLTMLESAPILGAIIVMEGITVGQHRSLIAADSLGMLWITLLMTGFALVAQGIHLFILMQAYRQASLDPLTGLLNRNALVRRIHEDLVPERGHSGNPFALILVDLDRFKVINDRYGHPVGDEVLSNLADTLLRHAGPNDLVARYGGEEFLLVAPDLDLDGAVSRAESLRNAVAASPFPTTAGPLEVTTSLGVSLWTPLVDSPEALVDTVDEALYRAKEEGRNRVIVAGGGSPAWAAS